MTRHPAGDGRQAAGGRRQATGKQRLVAGCSCWLTLAVRTARWFRFL